ncbi:MAG: hypothetical protein D6781_00725 [Verrucomicrobia bacterium]|nr:MAG: hypothetical protein D6781_00725 [Verrucomicrobiota bacterium]
MRRGTTGLYSNSTDWRELVGDGYTLHGHLRRQGDEVLSAGKIFHNSRVIRPSNWDDYAMGFESRVDEQRPPSGDRWCLIRYGDGATEPYDDFLDPDQRHNLADHPAYAAVRASLAEHLPAYDAPRRHRERRSRRGAKRLSEKLDAARAAISRPAV